MLTSLTLLLTLLPKKKKKSDPPVLVFNMYTRSWLSSYVEMNIFI